MTQDKRTVHLVIWLAFTLCFLNFCLYVFGIIVLLIYTKPEPTVIVALLSAASGNLSGAGFLALLARTRSDPQSVEVSNTSANPVPTDPQPHTEPEPTEPTEPLPDMEPGEDTGYIGDPAREIRE